MNTGRPSPLKNPHLQRRALKLLGQRQSMPAVAAAIGVCLNTLASWVQRYEDTNGYIDGRRRNEDMTKTGFDGTNCSRCGLSNPHVCLPMRAA